MEQQFIDAAMSANTTGVVRVNMLANLEALLNIMANAIEISAIAVGLALFVIGLKTHSESSSCLPQLASEEADKRARFKRHCGALLIKIGLLTPFGINWLVAGARDASLFN